MQPPDAHCDCCGLAVNRVDNYCQRCSYPTDPTQEKQFLRTSITDLVRVAAHGGSALTVTDLLNRYQQRLAYLQRPITAPATTQQAQEAGSFVGGPTFANVSNPSQPPTVPEALPSLSPLPTISEEILPAPAVPEPAFLFHTFFADQSINIVASLGAFLILVGSLSFVATTLDLLLAFLVLLSVHAFFGIIGIVTFRMPSVRIVSVIYTAIFALQIPLVGFTFYRLITNNLVQLSPPALIAITALYATITYGSLAIYQRFKPFGYLAAISLMIAEVALLLVWRLDIWWWSSAFLALAFPLLLLLQRSTSGSTGQDFWVCLREPARVLLYICVGASFLLTGLLWVLLFPSLIHNRPPVFVRNPQVLLAALFLVWICLYIWRVRRYVLIQLVPYVFLGLILSLLYACFAAALAYGIVLTLVALSYWILTRQLLRQVFKTALAFLPLKALMQQLEHIIIVLALLVPFIFEPGLGLYVVLRSGGGGVALMPGFGLFVPRLALFVELLAMVMCSLLLVGVTINHTGWQKRPRVLQESWCWLLLCSGLVLTYAYNLLLVWGNLSPVWGLFVFSLLWISVAYLLRRWLSSQWAYPLALLALLIAFETLLLSLSLTSDARILLLLLYIACTYAAALLFQRSAWYVLPFSCAVISLFDFSLNPSVFLAVSVLFPLLAVGAYHVSERIAAIRQVLPHRESTPVLPSSFSTIWPLLAIGLLYGVAFGLHEAGSVASVVSVWWNVPGTFSLEMALLAMIWYGVALNIHVKVLQVVALGFACIALFSPMHPFWLLTGLAFSFLLLALLVRSRIGWEDASFWYIVAVFAAVMVGLHGPAQGFSFASSWMLLGFAAWLYLVGVVEEFAVLQLVLFGLSTVLACWAIYAAGMLGDLYRVLLLTVMLAGVGVGIRFRIGASAPERLAERIRYVWPVYVPALFAAGLTGVLGMEKGVNAPFYAAIPMMLFIFALTAYGISLVEKSRPVLSLVLLFALWGMLLLPSAVTCSVAVQLPLFGPASCQMQLQLVLWGLATVTLICCALGIVGMRLMSRWRQSGAMLAWGWIWYAVSLGSMGITCSWLEIQSGVFFNVELLAVLILLTLSVFVVLLVERAPELMLLFVFLAVWTLMHTIAPLWLQLSLFNGLFILTFLMQFIWHSLAPRTHLLPAQLTAQCLALLGQGLVVFGALVGGGLVAASGTLAHIGAASLLVFAALILWTGWIQQLPARRQRYLYGAGCLFSIVVSWELSALGQTDASLLCASPAVYFLVVAPFAGHDLHLPERHELGQFFSICGAVFLLAPTLWLSFSHNNIVPSLLLAGESLVLLMLGFITRTRFFVLSAAALIIVTAIHVLFLPSLGIPTFLALFLVGIILVILATALLLIRARLASIWSKMD